MTIAIRIAIIVTVWCLLWPVVLQASSSARSLVIQGETEVILPITHIPPEKRITAKTSFVVELAGRFWRIRSSATNSPLLYTEATYDGTNIYYLYLFKERGKGKNDAIGVVIPNSVPIGCSDKYIPYLWLAYCFKPDLAVFKNELPNIDPGKVITPYLLTNTFPVQVVNSLTNATHITAIITHHPGSMPIWTNSIDGPWVSPPRLVKLGNTLGNGFTNSYLSITSHANYSGISFPMGAYLEYFMPNPKATTTVSSTVSGGRLNMKTTSWVTGSVPSFGKPNVEGKEVLCTDYRFALRSNNRVIKSVIYPFFSKWLTDSELEKLPSFNQQVLDNALGAKESASHKVFPNRSARHMAPVIIAFALMSLILFWLTVKFWKAFSIVGITKQNTDGKKS